MLMQFPTPYPDEWWWSVLCRYFVRSGYLKDIKVIREMFPSPSRVHPRSLGRLFPSDSVYKAWKQLPEGEHAWERPLSNVLQAFVMLPFETAITMAFINLEETLRGRGYSVKGKTTLDAPKVYADCYDFCGEEISAQYFSRVPPSQLYHICHWKLTAPERYALLAVMAGLTAEELFSRRRPLPNQHLEKLLALREKGEIYDKEALAGAVNLPLHEFNALTRKYDIQPFWVEDKAKESTPYAVNVILSAAEREQFKQALAQSGFRYPRHFAHHCIMEYLDTHFDQSKED